MSLATLRSALLIQAVVDRLEHLRAESAMRPFELEALAAAKAVLVAALIEPEHGCDRRHAVAEEVELANHARSPSKSCPNVLTRLSLNDAWRWV